MRAGTHSSLPHQPLNLSLHPFLSLNAVGFAAWVLPIRGGGTRWKRNCPHSPSFFRERELPFLLFSSLSPEECGIVCERLCVVCSHFHPTPSCRVAKKGLSWCHLKYLTWSSRTHQTPPGGGRGSGSPSYIFQILVDAAHAAGTPRRYFYLLPLFFFARRFFTPPPRIAPPPPPPPRPASC